MASSARYAAYLTFGAAGATLPSGVQSNEDLLFKRVCVAGGSLGSVSIVRLSPHERGLVSTRALAKGQLGMCRTTTTLPRVD